MNLYVPAPRISLCRHAEPGCGVAAKKSQVRPRSRRINATIVDETSLLGVTAVLGGGGARLRTRDRGLGHSFGGLFTTLNTQAKFYFYNYEFYGQPSLGRTSFKTIIVIIYVMSVKIASLVAGNVVTFLQP